MQWLQGLHLNLCTSQQLLNFTSKTQFYSSFIMHLSILSSSTKETRKIFPWYHDWVYGIFNIVIVWAPNIVLHNMQMTKGILSKYLPHIINDEWRSLTCYLPIWHWPSGVCAAFIPHLLLSINVKFSEDSASSFCSHSILHFNFAVQKYKSQICCRT